MALAYQCTADGYEAGTIEDYGLLPVNSTYVVPPKEKDGFIRKFDFKKEKWSYVENHKGKNGYVNGEPFEMKEYGPLPAGWSDTPPPPTAEEKAEQIRNERDSKIAATDYLMLPDNWNKLSDLEKKALENYRQALRDITAQKTFPDEVKWPDKPNCVK